MYILRYVGRSDLPELMRQEGFAGLQHYWLTPWFERVRFGRWDEIATTPNPAPDLPYVTAIWHYAQGMAAVRQDASTTRSGTSTRCAHWRPIR